MKKILICIATVLTLNLIAADYNAVLWEYNHSMQLEKMTEFADSKHPRSTEYQYSLTGKIDELIKPDGTIITYTYDFKDRIREVRATDGSIDATYFYNIDDSIKRIDDKATISVPHTFEVKNTYDDLGRKAYATYPDGSGVHFEYQGAYLKKITRVSKEGEELYTHEYQWGKEGKVKKALLPKEKGEISYTWDHLGRIQKIESPYWSEEMDYTSQGYLKKFTVKDSTGTFETPLSYDADGRIISERENRYSYDPLNNLTAINQSEKQIDDYNQTIETEDARYRYDANGNLASKEKPDEIIHYRYDALDRLTHVTIVGKEEIIYSYDTHNRRLIKKITNWDQSETKTLYYIFDGSNEVGCMDEGGNIIELRILGMGLGAEIGAAVALELNNHFYIPIHDHRGNSSCLIDMESGEVAETCHYSAFGETDCPTHSINPWRFYSKRFDSETGFTFFGKRYFSPDLGKWTTPDPLGYGDNSNRYVFLNNNPVNSIDLYGLFSVSAFWQCIKSGLQDWYNVFKQEINPNGSAEEFDRSVKEFYHHFLGEGFNSLSEKEAEEGFVGIYEGKKNGSIKISFINGILNNRTHVLNIAESISNLNGGQEVYYVCRGTQGWTRDVLKGFFVKLGLISSEAQEIASVWKRLIHDLGGTDSGGTVIHYAHSIGATETMRARKLMSKEELEMIQVIAVGPASIIPDEKFQSVVNFVSVRDGVCWLDPVSYIDALANKPSHVIFLGAYSDGIPGIEHLFQAYWNYLKNIFENE